MAVVTNCEGMKGFCTVKADKTQKCTVSVATVEPLADFIEVDELYR
ncbi:hypothetical protein [Photobacterium sanguinicancri]|nr:hypothetical protein [Photobacterium sanguinicancri]